MSGSILPGISTGLCAAFFSSLSYLGTRYFTHTRSPKSTSMLLVLSHVEMGAVSAIALPILLYGFDLTLPPVGQWIGMLALLVGLYLIGHTGLFIALQNTEPSRVSPMMALKLIVLALLAMTLGHQPLSVLQYLAVGLCVIGGVSLNYTGGRLGKVAVFGIVLAIVFYSVSDWCATIFIRSLSADPIRASFAGFFLTYILAGLTMLPLLPILGSKRRKDWLDAIPFSATWYISVVALYTCFSLAGAVYGNILQSTRGIISIILAALIARMGHVHLEAVTPRAVAIRRTIAAVLMTLAIALYSYERERLEKPSSPAPAAKSETRP